MAASTASHRPIKGILKNKSSTTSTVVSSAEQADRSVPAERSKPAPALEAVGILASYPPAAAAALEHPRAADHRRAASDEDAGSDPESSEPGSTAALWAQKLAAAKGSEIKFRVQELESSGDEDSGDLSPEEREKKRQFEIKRKLHYNEGLNIKLARELISKDLNEDEDQEDEGDEEEEEEEEGEERVSVKTTAAHVRKQESSPGSASAQPKSPRS